MNASSDLGTLVDSLETFLCRFVAYPSEEARLAHVLWILHTHCMPAWESTPRLALLSPEPGSGKTRALELTETLAYRSVMFANASPAYIFRKVGEEEDPPTLLFDEIDTIFGPRARENEEIRGLLNAGYRRGASAGRCVVRGNVVKTEEIPAYAPVALAGLGNLPNTLLSRSIVIRMRRSGPEDRVEGFRIKRHSLEARVLHDMIREWVSPKLLERLENYEPEMAPGVDGRDADIWEPLIAIADEVGQQFGSRARKASLVLIEAAKDTSVSLGLRLLRDLEEIFSESLEAQIPTALILQKLNAMDEAPWGALRGHALDPRGLAKLLKPYGISSTTIRTAVGLAKGYRREDMHDTWRRYLAPIAATSR